MELNRVHLDITQLKQTHMYQLDKVDSEFNGKLLYEFQKYDQLKDDIDVMKERYERLVHFGWDKKRYRYEQTIQSNT